MGFHAPTLARTHGGTEAPNWSVDNRVGYPQNGNRLRQLAQVSVDPLRAGKIDLESS